MMSVLCSVVYQCAKKRLEVVMTAPNDFWLNEALMRHLAYKHLAISNKRLRSIACVAGYITPAGQLTAAGRIFAANIMISDPWLVQNDLR